MFAIRLWARLSSSLAFLVIVAAVRPPAHAEDPKAVLPNDPRVEGLASPEQFFGFAIGSRHLRHDQLVSYLGYLADHSDRVQRIPYGATHGQRPLLVVAITSPENHAQLDEIRLARRRLASGKSRTVPDDARLVMYMGYNVHGDEASAANAVPLVAYHLASSTSDEVAGWLRDSVFLIDPALNPDGLDRFANWANDNRGRHANASTDDREHNQPWPGGRTNHYWFDLNRDWMPLVHPESRGRVRLFHQWKPNVVLDFHEMSGTSSYFFQPGVPERNNPLSPAETLRLTRAFAIEHAKAMDEAGELFFTEEKFDDFYIGKGSTYPDVHGAIGILFEQGSTRALRLRNQRTDRHFRDTVANQVRTSLSSLRAAARHRDELLRHQVNFHADALAAGQAAKIRAYVLSGSPERIAGAQDLLSRHAIRSHRPSEPIHVAGNTIPTERALVVPTAQPEYTFIRSLFETPQSFRENIFYDVSTWHLPSALGLDSLAIDSDLPANWLTDLGQPPDPAASRGFVRRSDVAGYLIDPTEWSSPRVVAALLRLDADVRVANQAISIPLPTAANEATSAADNPGDEPVSQLDLPIGTFIVPRQPNLRRWDRVLAVLEAAAARGDVVAIAADSSHTLTGPDLGSDSMGSLQRSRPFLVVGDGTSQLSAGAIWHFLDVRMRQPVTLVDTHRLTRVALSEASCVILPTGSYGGWGTTEVELLQRYVREGGTVIATASAIRWLSQRKLISPADDASDASPIETTGVLAEPVADSWRQPFGAAGDAAALETIAGAFWMTRIDPTHPLAYGFPTDRVPVFRNHTQRHAVPKNPYQLAARYEQVIAGYVSDRNRNRLTGSAAAWVEPSGRGRYILLVDDPVFRGYVRSSERFLTNAILLGPSLQIPNNATAPLP